jgi:putative phage-type endonuclease
MEPIIHRDIEQGTSEWLALRAGCFTASSAATIMGGLDTDGLKRLVKGLAWERTYGPMTAGFKSDVMKRGSELEPESRDWYAFEKGVQVEQVAFVEHATIPYVGWSPDGLCGRGAIEAKNPLELAWMDIRRKPEVPSEYVHQGKWAMWVGQLEWLDFVFYHPKAGGLIIPASISETDKQRMEERVCLLEPRVAEWIEILTT